LWDRSANAGLATVKKAPGFCRSQVRDIVRFHLKKNTPQGVSAALKIAMCFSAAGRGGEAMYSNYNTMYFDPDTRRMVDDWAEKKTLSSKPMTWGPDWEFLELDVFFLLGAYFITSGGAQYAYGGGNPADNNFFVHPDLAGLSNPASAAVKISEWLKVTIFIFSQFIFYYFYFIYFLFFSFFLFFILFYVRRLSEKLMDFHLIYHLIVSASAP
jgi:hypothetical protein